MMKTIGIDIGGTQTRVALFENESLLQQTRFATETTDPEKQIQRLVEAIATFAVDYCAIGIACPGPLDSKKGLILNPPNLPGWHNFPLQKAVSTVTGKPVVIENDANLAAFAEAKVGAGKGANVVQFLTLSTGVGAGLVVDQKIFAGSRGFAQEVANCIVDEMQAVAGETVQGSVERLCSGTGIYRLAKQANLTVENTADVFQLANHGDQQAQAILAYTSEKTANFVASIQGMIDPDLFVIGGSVALHNPDYVQQIEQLAREKVYTNVAPFVKCELATCGDQAGVIGAGLWAQQQFGGEQK